MKRIFATLLIVLFIAVSAYSQPQATIIKSQALEMVRALQNKDFATFLRYMHPNIISMAGGADKMIQKLDTANAMASQFGAEIKKITIGNPGKVVSYKKELQVTLPQTTEMTSGFGDASFESTLLAISSDGGKTWKFIDTSVTNVRELKKAMPDLSPELVIPAPKPPKFTMKPQGNN